MPPHFVSSFEEYDIASDYVDWELTLKFSASFKNTMRTKFRMGSEDIRGDFGQVVLFNDDEDANRTHITPLLIEFLHRLEIARDDGSQDAVLECDGLKIAVVAGTIEITNSSQGSIHWICDRTVELIEDLIVAVRSMLETFKKMQIEIALHHLDAYLDFETNINYCIEAANICRDLFPHSPAVLGEVARLEEKVEMMKKNPSNIN